MHRLSRRGALTVAVLASVGTGSALAASTASAAPAQPRLCILTLCLPDVPVVTPIITPVTGPLQTVLDQVGAATPEQVQGLVGGLGAGDIGSLLTGANSDQLLSLIAGLTPEQLQGALATLTPAQQQQVAKNVAAAQAAKAAPKPGTTAAKPFSAYRARVGSVRVSKDRRSVRFKITCPAIAPKGCYARVSGKVAGRKAMTPKDFLLARNSSQNGSVRLSASAAKRLKSKGGTLALTTQTLSSLPAVTKNTRVKASASAKA
jgi:hypothetical protein